ncbi:two-component system, OmpR family, sensor histidine kinase KdpD [Kaistia soli DSM 19436]|uniref:histidine kinase n=1 Tax=Kaistia soli DSM 19436 TaxID=1122133 RepID=A0A1M4TXK7_9HYPH|nr:sensor histidine kinase KdpD [Kaistia soli]SHE49143.1 two-component system, OmpR family, sensor histidine kinase KdpD [Kaistia soli DSM 19436]
MSDRKGNDERLDPDLLLASAGAEGRGRLTVFLGAAPGVGKTYAMLSRAGRLRDSGIDVVIGLVETHGRADTAALLAGLEVLPRRPAAENRGIEAFDLDAALARHPRVMIVDELAASNPTGSRHPKRYQDIEELLGAGIDVWTALNIQHLESLADVVADITGVRVRERVPDVVLSKSDEVVLVDLPPAELIERLKDGKVYLPDNARRASELFFRLGNLTALRELALRRTADLVDDDVVDYVKRHAIKGAWASSERLIVCIGPDGLSERVVRTASRLASGLNAPFIVVSLERADHEVRADDPARIDALFRLAESLGGETRRLVSTDFVSDLLKLARSEHATQFVVGSKIRRRWWPFRGPTLGEALVARAGGLAVHLITEERDEQPRPARPRRRLFVQVSAVAHAVASVALATALGVAIGRLVPLSNVSLLFLLAVVVSAIRAGHVAALIAAVLSGLAYNFFFIQPLYTFTIASPHEVFAFTVFLVAALFAGGLASRVREQAEMARARAVAVQSLYDFARKLSRTARTEDVLWAAVSQLNESFGRPAVLLMPNGEELTTAAAWPPDAELDVTDMTAGRWAFEHNEPAGQRTGTLPASAYQFRPLSSPHGVVGVCGIGWGGQEIDGQSERMLLAVMDQAAIAIDRARLADESIAQATRLQSETLRAALLSSISHDLRTPLATITGAVTSLRELGDRMEPESRDDLLLTIEEEGARLSRFVANLLDMTRIESGSLEVRRDWLDVADVIRAAVERCRRYFPDLVVETSIAADLPLMQGDGVLLGQVLFNLLDNASKYAAGEPVRIYARREADAIVISVTDLGSGIAKADLETVFDKFYRRGKADGRAPGTGLGLSIARGFVEAMGGTIHAESPAQRRRGTRMVIRFPLPEPGKTIAALP